MGGGGGLRTPSKRKSDENFKTWQLKKPWEPSPPQWAILPQGYSLFSISLHSAEKRLTFLSAMLQTTDELLQEIE